MRGKILNVEDVFCDTEEEFEAYPGYIISFLFVKV